MALAQRVKLGMGTLFILFLIEVPKRVYMNFGVKRGESIIYIEVYLFNTFYIQIIMARAIIPQYCYK